MVECIFTNKLFDLTRNLNTIQNANNCLISKNNVINKNYQKKTRIKSNIN